MKKGKGRNNGLLPNSLRIISSCLKTVSSNAGTVASTVRSASASISASSEDHKDQVTWAGFDKLETSPSHFKRILLLGYITGFQVLEVDDASNFSELVSKRDGPVTFLQMQPLPADLNGPQGFRTSHPLLLVVSGEHASSTTPGHQGNGIRLSRDIYTESEPRHMNPSSAVQFYSLKSHSYVHVLRFRSAVCMVRCSPRIIAISLAAQIYCFDAVTLENKFSVLTYPVPQLAGQGPLGVNFGFGPMAVGPRWLAYASNNPLSSTTGRLSPQNLAPSPGVSPSTYPGNGNLVARYAVESSKHLAAGIINLGDMGYKTFSKYCQELRPDGSNSPVSSSTGWKVGRLTGIDSDNAGIVVIKDLVSRDVIVQFKAHTSPISALCFDPSGTLLVTASVYGTTINIFRIMPHSMPGGSEKGFNWNSGHVHLYKLHRGITSAIIQDICFSHYSQWVGIVSSKGTCHVFILCPFGGDPGIQNYNFQGDTSSFPVISLPWWNNSSFMSNQQSSQPPLPVTLSVVSRIKYNDSGWLNTVSNAAASATGKVFVPSGAVAAVFHNSNLQNMHDHNSRNKCLEHLLVYTPSGHVIQHKLLPSNGNETDDAVSRTRPGSFLQIQEDELKVKVEPVQWWDVCRRSDWPEREDCQFGACFDHQNAADSLNAEAENRDNYAPDSLVANKCQKLPKNDMSKLHERSRWYLSNAEVQVSSGRLPVWQKSEICLYTMCPPVVNVCAQGEFEIEKLPFHEVEVKRKELLPVFDNFQGVKSCWNDRALPTERYHCIASLELHQAKVKPAEETVICHSKPASLSSTESSEGGSSRRIDNLPDFDQVNTEKTYAVTCHPFDEFYQETNGGCILEPSTPKHSSTAALAAAGIVNNVDNAADKYIVNVGNVSLFDNISLVNSFNGPVSLGTVPSLVNASSAEHRKPPGSILDDPDLATARQHVDLGILFQEGYCDALELNKCYGLAEAKADEVDNSGHHEREKPEDDVEDEEMLGGVFAFSEG